MDRDELAGRTVALLFIAHDDRDPDAWQILLTIARWVGPELMLTVDLEHEQHPFFPVGDQLLGQIRPTTPAIRTALGGAEFFVALPPEALPPEVDVAAYVASRLESP